MTAQHTPLPKTVVQIIKLGKQNQVMREALEQIVEGLDEQTTPGSLRWNRTQQSMRDKARRALAQAEEEPSP